MSETGGAGFESFSGSPQGKEKAAEGQEQFSERYRKNQQAIKRIQQEEGKKKQQDDSLAHIIVAFLQQSGTSQSGYFILISRLIARNIPSDIILAILALVYHPAKQTIEDKLLALPAPKDAQAPGKQGLFSAKMKQSIDSWTNSIVLISVPEARRILLTAQEPDETPNPGLTQLFTIVLRDFLEKEHENLEFEKLQAFGKAFFLKLFETLRKHSEKELQLESGS